MQPFKIITAVLTLSSSLVFSQNYKTSLTVKSGKEFPKIDADGKSQFKVYFPEAKSVILEGGDGMQNVKSTTAKDKEGFWNISTSPLEIGFHYYWFNVDENELTTRIQNYISVTDSQQAELKFLQMKIFSSIKM